MLPAVIAKTSIAVPASSDVRICFTLVTVSEKQSTSMAVVRGPWLEAGVRVKASRQVEKHGTATFQTLSAGKTTYITDQVVFTKGDRAGALFRIAQGQIKLSVVSNEGTDAVIAILGAGDFFGEGCPTAQKVRMATATSVSGSSVFRIAKTTALGLL
jgi:CRP-like cAMP-binding protein